VNTVPRGIDLTEDWVLAALTAHIEYDDETTYDGGVVTTTLCESLGVSRSGVEKRLNRLKDEGKVHRQPAVVPHPPGSPWAWHLGPEEETETYVDRPGAGAVYE